MEMIVQEPGEKDSVVVHLRGDCDLYSAPRLKVAMLKKIEVAIPLKSAGSSGVILPPVYFMLIAAREFTQPAGMAQASDCSRWPLRDRIDIPESEILIA